MASDSAGDRARTTWHTALTSIEPNTILVRGYPIDELMGRVPFGDAIYLLLTGDLPSASISTLINAMLVSFIDHGVTPPSTIAARSAATTGASIRGAVAAGVLGFGRHYGADIHACRARLEEGLTLEQTMPIAAAADQIVERLVQSGEIPPPGFGHRYHTRDPRAARILQIAHELEVDSRYTRFVRELERALARHPALAGRPVPVNVDGAIAAVSCDLGLSPDVADALLLISRVPGLCAHVLEEQTRETPMRIVDSLSHRYDGPPERRVPNRRK